MAVGMANIGLRIVLTVAMRSACLLCGSQVIEPIQSRCAIVRFTKVPDADILSRLQIVSDGYSSPACTLLL
jgi:hypothetical protein